MYRILVTGSSGFIGKPLVSAIVAAGHHVRAAARTPSSLAAEWVNLPDITQPVDWTPLVAGMDVVIHLAAIAHRQNVEVIDYEQANTAAVADLARACMQTGIKRLIFLSSIGVQTGSYADHVLTELDPPQPDSDYGRAKLAAEYAVRASGVAHTILRPTVVFGPHPVANVAQLVALARFPGPLPFGAFTNRRSMLALDNLISAIVFCLSASTTLHETFIVSNPDVVSFRDVLATLRRAKGGSQRLLDVPPQILRTVLAAIGRKSLWEKFGTSLEVSPHKLIAAGWRPVVTMEEALIAMMRTEAAHP